MSHDLATDLGRISSDLARLVAAAELAELRVEVERDRSSRLLVENERLRARIAAANHRERRDLTSTRKRADVAAAIAEVLELDPRIVRSLVEGRYVARVHPIIAERARVMWIDATTDIKQKDTK